MTGSSVPYNLYECSGKYFLTNIRDRCQNCYKTRSDYKIIYFNLTTLKSHFHSFTIIHSVLTSRIREAKALAGNLTAQPPKYAKSDYAMLLTEPKRSPRLDAFVIQGVRKEFLGGISRNFLYIILRKLQLMCYYLPS